VGTVVEQIYEVGSVGAFLARVLGKRPFIRWRIARESERSWAYGPGEALNWHFDRAQFSPRCSSNQPSPAASLNTGAVALGDGSPLRGGRAPAKGQDSEVCVHALGAGTLNVLQVRTRRHRITRF